MLPEAQVGDERDYVCVVKAGAAGTAEATARLKVFGECLCLPSDHRPRAQHTHILGRGREVRTPGTSS